MIGQIERVARTGAIPVTLARSDIERLSGHERRSAARDPQIIPASLIIAAAILAPSIPLAAGAAAAAALGMLVWTGLHRG